MWVDLLIIVLIVGVVYRGWESGFMRQFWASLGFFIGLLAGRWLSPHTIGLASSANSKALIALTTVVFAALLFLTAGEFIGLYLKHRLVLKRLSLNKLDNGLGSLVSVVAAVFSIWLLASLTNSLPYDGLKSTVRSSHIVSGLNRLLPPAPDLIANLERFIDPNGFPDVFVGNEPIPKGKVSLPELGDFESAVNADKDSVVRIKGQGCGGIVTGSGFVIAPDRIATNAHVVAGIDKPIVQDTNGNHRATVVWFDPDLDFAVLQTSGLAGKPLKILNKEVAPATPAAVLGYPGGGDFTAGAAAVLDEIAARGRNIYGTGHTLRNVYEIQATIVPGNSGGPLIAKDGSVIGVIFAESTTYENVGYALTTTKVLSEIKQAAGNTAPVGTGQCAE